MRTIHRDAELTSDQEEQKAIATFARASQNRIRIDGAMQAIQDKLREELPGVLAWAVRGCVEWSQGGLGTSAAVDAATAEYRTETDVTQRFFVDECVFGEQHSVTRKALFEAWEKWALDEGEEPGKQNSFTRLLNERSRTLNVRDGKAKSGARVWRGIGLKSDRPDPPTDKVTVPETPANPQKNLKDGHFSEESLEVQLSPPIRGTSEEIDEKVTATPKVTAQPQTFEFKDITITYHGEGE